MMGFADSLLFQLDEFGVMRHKRDGGTYADRLLDGVDIDLSMYFENSGYAYIEEEGGEEIVGERKTDGEIQETSTIRGKEKGEGKFKRTRPVPQKKTKRYPTKPKPKHSWHKRLSKVARELGDVNGHTEFSAVQEIGDFYDERYNMEKGQEEEYWTKIEAEARNSAGYIAVITSRNTLGPDGNYIYDIDEGSVNRSTNFYGGGPGDLEQCPAWAYKQDRFFTYWDEENKMYVWEKLNSGRIRWDWNKHFHYEPSFERIQAMYGNSSYLDGFVNHIDGIDWEEVWTRMNVLRTGVWEEYMYDEGDDFLNRSVQISHSRNMSEQLPIIKFY